MLNTEATGIAALENLYVIALAKSFETFKLSAMMQDFGDSKCRLWLTPDGTTVPQAHVDIAFRADDVLIRVATRSDREFTRTVKFAEGLDGFLEELAKFMSQGLLAGPVSKSPSNVRRIS